METNEMQKTQYHELRAGLPAIDREGRPVGTITGVHLEPPEGTMASGTGYIEIDASLSDRSVHLHVPLTRIFDVQADRVVVDPDG
jgi:hypothetical protein